MGSAWSALYVGSGERPAPQQEAILWESIPKGEWAFVHLEVSDQTLTLSGYGRGSGISDDINVMGRMPGTTNTGGVLPRGCLRGNLAGVHLWLRGLTANERLTVYQGFNQVRKAIER